LGTYTRRIADIGWGDLPPGARGRPASAPAKVPLERGNENSHLALRLSRPPWIPTGHVASLRSEQLPRILRLCERPLSSG
jgi:hypothetical protein